MEFVIEHGGEVIGDTLHSARPDCLNPGLFDGLENGASLLTRRQQAAVNR
jgi:hypothetical protein